jgi:hypothetical protein
MRNNCVHDPVPLMSDAIKPVNRKQNK